MSELLFVNNVYIWIQRFVYIVTISLTHETIPKKIKIKGGLESEEDCADKRTYAHTTDLSVFR